MRLAATPLGLRRVLLFCPVAPHGMSPAAGAQERQVRHSMRVSLGLNGCANCCPVKLKLGAAWHIRPGPACCTEAAQVGHLWGWKSVWGGPLC